MASSMSYPAPNTTPQHLSYPSHVILCKYDSPLDIAQLDCEADYVAEQTER